MRQHWPPVSSIYQRGFPRDRVDDKNYLKHQTFNILPPHDPNPSFSHKNKTNKTERDATISHIVVLYESWTLKYKN